MWHVVSSKHSTLKSEGNFNNQIGVSLTLLRLSPCHKWAILEMGMNSRGEIARLAEIIEPRMEEMLLLVHREIQTSGYMDMAPAGVVMTGGASLLEAATDLAEQIFEMAVRIGYPREVRGLADKVRAPIYATGVGLILHGAKERSAGNGPRRFIKANHFNRIMKRMKDWLSTYF